MLENITTTTNNSESFNSRKHSIKELIKFYDEQAVNRRSSSSMARTGSVLERTSMINNGRSFRYPSRLSYFNNSNNNNNNTDNISNSDEDLLFVSQSSHRFAKTNHHLQRLIELDRQIEGRIRYIGSAKSNMMSSQDVNSIDHTNTNNNTDNNNNEPTTRLNSLSSATSTTASSSSYNLDDSASNSFVNSNNDSSEKLNELTKRIQENDDQERPNSELIIVETVENKTKEEEEIKTTTTTTTTRQEKRGNLLSKLKRTTSSISANLSKRFNGKSNKNTVVASDEPLASPSYSCQNKPTLANNLRNQIDAKLQRIVSLKQRVLISLGKKTRNDKQSHDLRHHQSINEIKETSATVVTDNKLYKETTPVPKNIKTETNQQKIEVCVKSTNENNNQERPHQLFDKQKSTSSTTSTSSTATKSSESSLALSSASVSSTPTSSTYSTDSFNITRTTKTNSALVTTTTTTPIPIVQSLSQNIFSPIVVSSRNSTATRITQRHSFVKYDPRNVQQKLLEWCRMKTARYKNVQIRNFSTSWSDGLAFCALIHSQLGREAFDYDKLTSENRRQNFTLAFDTAYQKANIIPLLEVNDMILMGNRPDDRCIFTYVSTIYTRFKELNSISTRTTQLVRVE